MLSSMDHVDYKIDDKEKIFWSVKYTSHPPRSAYFSEGVFREWLAA